MEKHMDIVDELRSYATDWRIRAGEADPVQRAIAEIERLRKENDAQRETLQGIAYADYRRWQELASPDEFERWARSRAMHALRSNT